MNYSVDTKLAGVVYINNPTCYHPDTIIRNTFKERGETVKQAFNESIANGIDPKVTAQDLFTRAVHNEEYYSNKNFMFYMILTYEFFQILSYKETLLKLILEFGARFLLHYLVGSCLFETIDYKLT